MIEKAVCDAVSYLHENRSLWVRRSTNGDLNVELSHCFMWTATFALQLSKAMLLKYNECCLKSGGNFEKKKRSGRLLRPYIDTVGIAGFER